MNHYTTTDEVLSHPQSQNSSEKTLLSHIEGVKNNALKLQPPKVSENIPNPTELLTDIAYLHDIGKTTQHFQRYIRDEQYTHNLKQHGTISAVIADYIIGEKYESEYIQLVAHIVIKNHHGYLQRNLNTELKTQIKTNPSATETRHRLKEQIEDMKPAQKVVNTILKKCDSTLQYADLREKTVTKNPQKYIRLRDWTKTETLYEDALSLWATLITADKLDASGLSNTYFTHNATTINHTKLEDHIASIQSNLTNTNITTPITDNTLSKINQLREQARKNAIEWATNYEKPTNTTIYNLSLPTGFGKTYAGLSAALRVANKKDGNIIYALPFTSIIDQVDEELQDIFKVSPTDPEYTIHHYLAETKTTLSNKSDTDSNSRNEFMLAKSWNSHITLTTFVQLFESLTAPKNTQALKIPALKNSVIILDEPQALSYDWWHLIPKLAAFLTNKYNATIISMTATQPLLFKNSPNIDTITEILPNKETYYNHLKQNNRVTYKHSKQLEKYLQNGIEATPDNYNTIATSIKNDLNQLDSVCAICNTVKSAQTLTEKVETQIQSVNFVNPQILSNETKKPKDALKDDTINLIHLSTRITPFDRRRLLNAIQYANNTNQKLCVISTQLIEAGVDISFNKLYRDLAPITSIIQAGGRCNRNNELQTGTIIITRLGPPEDTQETTPAAVIYNSSIPLIDATRNTLTKNTTYTEGEFIQLTTEFYNHLSNTGNKSYIEYLQNYNVEKLDKLSLITNYETIDVSITTHQHKESLFGKQPYDTLNTGHKQHILSELEEHTTSIPLPTNTEKQQQTRKQLGVNFAEQYYLPRNSKTYNKKYGLKITDPPNQFI